MINSEYIGLYWPWLTPHTTQ